MVHLKMKILIIEVNTFMRMKATTSLFSMLQQCQVYWNASHWKDKTKFIELCLYQRHGHMFWVLRYFHLKFHTPIGMLVLSEWNFFFFFFFFFNFVKFLWSYMSVHHFYSCRLFLILLGDIKRALAGRWY